MGLFDRFKNQDKGQEFFVIAGLGNPGREMQKQNIMLVFVSLIDWRRNIILM